MESTGEVVDSIENKESSVDANQDDSVTNEEAEEDIDEEITFNRKKRAVFLTSDDSDEENDNKSITNAEEDDDQQVVDKEIGEDDDNQAENHSEVNSDEEDVQIAPLQYKRKSSKKSTEIEDENRKMSAREALEQRKEIDSESQRMLRETNISLPYHKPKQRSLLEFLKSRSRFAEVVPEKVHQMPTASAIKMSKEHLEVISLKLKEREKQVETFYKSDSESEKEENESEEFAEEILSELIGNVIDLSQREKVEVVKKESKVKSWMSAELAELRPKLRGEPNLVIDLEKGTTFQSEISVLMDRFMQHSGKRNITKKPSKVELDVVCVSQSGDIYKERLALKAENNEEPEIVETPGVKFKQLRQNLREQMAKKRNEQWMERQRLKEEKQDEEQEEEKECCVEDDFLDDEAEFTDDEEEFSSSDEEEEDEERKTKKLKRIINNPDESEEEEEKVEETKNLHIDSTISCSDDDLPTGGQTNTTCKTPMKKVESRSELGFLSPGLQLTGLQSFDCTSKFLPGSPGSPAVKLKPVEKSWSKSLFQSAASELGTQELYGNTQDLLELCSGDFTNATTQEVNEVRDDEDKEVGIDATDEDLISQLIDEDEEEEEIKPVKRNRTQQIVDSDDEENEEEEEEEIDLNEDVELGYDSEENEVPMHILQEKKKKEKFKVANFVENEAELSGSEWGSEDEDEQNLDELEYELGDSEKFNEKQLRRDLEQIHVRRLIDEDKRDIKQLQELLLNEDEELQGAGRQRQFRWRNIDSETVDGETAVEDENNQSINDDEINEEEWRKKRYEREVFLQSQKDKRTLPPNLQNKSQVFQLGQRAIIQNNKTAINHELKPVSKQAYAIQSQRGSFLTRNDEVLARVAEYTKANDVVIGAVKNSKNFLFQSVTNRNLNEDAKDKKRKAMDDGTPLALKKLRLNGSSPAGKPQVKSKVRLF